MNFSAQFKLDWEISFEIKQSWLNIDVSQMQIIWRALITYVDNNLRAGKSVNMKKFGAFTFDITTELPKISTRRIGADSDMNSERQERKHIHKLRYLSIN